MVLKKFDPKIFLVNVCAAQRRKRLRVAAQKAAKNHDGGSSRSPKADSPGHGTSTDEEEAKRKRFCFKPQTLDEAMISQRGLLHAAKAAQVKGKAQAKEKAKKRHTKGVGGQAAKKYNAVDIRFFSNQGSASCRSSGCTRDCYNKVDFHTTRHYREILWASGNGRGNRYERRKFVYSLLLDEVKRERLWRSFNRKLTREDGSNMRLTYRLQDPSTGCYFHVCQSTFCGVLGLSKGTLSYLVKQAKAGKPLVRDKHLEKIIAKKQQSPEYQGIVTYLETLTEDLANHSPDCRVTELPSGFKVHFYDMFCADWKKGLLKGVYNRSAGRSVGKNAEKPPSKALFYRVWRTEFPHLKVPKRNNRFSKCDWCTGLKTHLESARTRGDQEEVNYWKSCLYDHYSWVSLQRRKYHKHRRKAAENPGK